MNMLRSKMSFQVFGVFRFRKRKNFEAIGTSCRFVDVILVQVFEEIPDWMRAVDSMRQIRVFYLVLDAAVVQIRVTDFQMAKLKES